MIGGGTPFRPHRALAMAAMLAAAMRDTAAQGAQMMVDPATIMHGGGVRFPLAPGVRRPPPYPGKRPGNGRRLKRARPMRAAGRRRRAFLRKARR